VTAAKLELEIGGRILSIETGRIARQAHGAVVMRLGDTVVMVTACAQKKPREGVDFLPLTVDYRENTYAAGKIPGGFFKREGRPNDKETLTSRLIDRPLRPLFPKGWNCETQVIALVLSADIENDPDILGVTGASAALFISEIPFVRPIAAVRVGLVDGRYVINPTTTELAASRLDLVVAGTADAIVMVEAGAREISESEAISAIYAAHEEIKKIVALQHKLREMVGRPKRSFTSPEVDHAFEFFLRADRQLDRHRIGLQTVLDLIEYAHEIGALPIHLVDEREARHAVLVRLAPDGFGLRLHTTDRAIDHARTIEHAHAALDLDREVDVSRRVDDVDAMLGKRQVHSLPERRRRRRGDRDAALLLLLHPVHGRRAVMHFTDLVVDAGVEQDALGGRGLAGVDVRRDTDVPVALDGGLAGHGKLQMRRARGEPPRGAARRRAG
jgi:ribonuclease PH